jgi:hypothetical protein
VAEAAGAALWCPRCLGRVGEAEACPACGLGQRGAEVARLRALVHRLYELGEQRRVLAAEADTLELERRRLLEAVAGARPAGAGPPAAEGARPPAEWRPAVVRGLLLGLGSTLVALAALIFTVVTWVRLGDLGRAGLLAAATLAAGAAAAAARRRLPATGEALGGLALALLLVDWYALRRAGVMAALPVTTWWALGTGTAAAAAALAGRWLPLQRPAAAVLAQVAGLLVVLELAAAPWTVAGGLALVATAAAGLAAGLARVAGWRLAVVTLAAGAAVLELLAVALVLQSPPIDDLATATGPALALATVALAPAIGVTFTRPTGRRAPRRTAGDLDPDAACSDPAPGAACSDPDPGPACSDPDPGVAPRRGSVADLAEEPLGSIHSPAGPADPTGATGPATPTDLAGSDPVVWHGLVSATVGALLGAAGALLAAGWTGWSLAAAVAVLGAGAVAIGRLLPRPLRVGTTLAASVTLAVGLVGLAEPLLWAVAAPAGWLVDPWTARLGSPAPVALDRLWGVGGGPGGSWPALVGLLATAGAALAAGFGPGSPAAAPWRFAVGAAATVAAVAVLPLTAGWPLWVALALTTGAALAAGGGAVLVDRGAETAATADPAGRERVAAVPIVLAGAAATLLLLAVSWALATEAGTLGFLGVVVAAAVAGVGTSRSAGLRRGWAVVAAGAVTGAGAAVAAAGGGDAAQAGFAVTLAAGLVLVVGTRWRPGAPEGPVAEVCGLAALAVGVALAVGGQRWLAASLTAAVPPLALAATEARRRGYLLATAAAATAATWAWLFVAGVTLVEAYALPAAIALAAGLAARRGPLRPGSWPAYGPGLALALLPSLAVAVDSHGLARPLLLSGGALVAVLAGARARLQAPLVLGAVTLVVLGADAALPVAARLPRWATVGATGLLLLWLGATAERRLARLRRLGRQLADLEPGAG